MQSSYTITPSHYLFFYYLQQNLHFLAELELDFCPQLAALNLKEFSKLKNLHLGLSIEEYVNHNQHFSLLTILDDTPIDSFLINLHNQLLEYEKKIFQTLANLPPAIQATILKRAQFFGRKQGQLLQESNTHRFYRIETKLQASNGLFQALTLYRNGGQLNHYRYLSRRVTNAHIEFEANSCPHRRLQSTSSAAANFACLVDAQLTQGFIEAVSDQYLYSRIVHSSTCVDKIDLR